MFQMLNSLMGLLAARLDGAEMEHFYQCRKLHRTVRIQVPRHRVSLCGRAFTPLSLAFFNSSIGISNTQYFLSKDTSLEDY